MPLSRVLFVLLSLSVTACASAQHRDMAAFQCPLGNMTHVNVSAEESPREFALETAARAAIRDGYDKFWVVKSYPEPDHSYTMLVRMIPNTDHQPLSPDMIVARDVLASTVRAPTPYL